MSSHQKPSVRIYIDESGDHTFHRAADVQWDRRYLCLLGCAFAVDEYERHFHPAFETIKTVHFGRDPDEPVILHREDMVAGRGVFSVLKQKSQQEAFNQEIFQLLAQANFRIFAVVVDKHTTQAKHYGPLPYHPYHIGLMAMMERYCGWLNYSRLSGDVLAESRGGREDGQLKAAYRTIYSAGTRYRNSDFFQQGLTSKEIKLKKKEHNIAGLQLADLLAYPIKRGILFDLKRGAEPSDFSKSVLAQVNSKFNCHFYNGRVSGYGKIFLG